MFGYVLGEVTLMFEGSPLLLSYLGWICGACCLRREGYQWWCSFVSFFFFLLFVAVACRMSHRPVLCLIVVARTE